MSVTKKAIQRNRVTAVALVALFFAGLSAFFRMPQQMDPGFIIRTAQVVTMFPGASPERVEQLVTDPIEQAVQSIPELDFVGSTSRTGVSIVSVNIKEKYSDMRPIWDSMRRKISAMESSLPKGVIGPDINDELGDTYPMLFSMTGDGFSEREMFRFAKTLRDDLLHMPGVAKVEILGEQDERVFVEYNDARLRQLGVSVETIKRTLDDRNIIMPGGQIDIGAERISLEPSGNFNETDEIERTLISLPGGGAAHLGDFTTVRRGYIDPPQGLVTVNGQSAITFAISMADGDNLVQLGKSVKAFFDDAAANYPHGIDFHQTYFQPQEVEDKVEEFMTNVYQAIGIVLVVMLVTLGLRTGLIVSTLIPGAMIITVLILNMMGESLNQMSLASLIIALGLLVDNAIVVSESIMVRMGNGEKAVDAAVNACKELQMPLLVSSLTTAAAFLPIYLAESMVGEYTGSLFTVVSITLLVSWVLALTMTPLLCTLFLKVEKKEEDPFDKGVYVLYRKILSFVIRGRWFSVVGVMALFVASLQLWQYVPQIFFPSQDSPFFMAQLSLPAGSSIEATLEMSKKVDEFIEDELMATKGNEEQGVLSWTTFVGETPPPFTLGYSPSPSLGGYCELMVNTSSVDVVKDTMHRLHEFAVHEFPDVRTHIRMLSAGPPVDKPVQVRVSGPDVDKVFKIVESIHDKLDEMGDARNISDNWGTRVKKLKVQVDEDRARRAGLTNKDVADTLQSFLSGKQATLYREDDKSIPVMVRSLGKGRRDLEKVRTLSVFSPAGRAVPLSQVADISLEWDDSAILRRDRYKTVTLEAGIRDGVTAIEVFNKLRPWLEEQEKSWGVGYRWEFGGEFESSVKANESIGVKLPIAFGCIVMLLVVQFNSIRKPIIVLSTIVLALIGVVVGLVVMKSSFGFMTLLGVVSLAGIVINNAIVLIDRIQIEMDENGLSVQQAAIVAAQQRVRPILLTTATTVASLIPLYLSGGAMWQPMAVAIMYGLVFSTVLTLGFVPLLFTLFFRGAKTGGIPMHELPDDLEESFSSLEDIDAALSDSGLSKAGFDAAPKTSAQVAASRLAQVVGEAQSDLGDQTWIDQDPQVVAARKALLDLDPGPDHKGQLDDSQLHEERAGLAEQARSLLGDKAPALEPEDQDLEDSPTLEDPTGAQLEDPIGAQLERSTGAQLERSTGAQLERSTGAQLERSTGAQLERSTEAQLEIPTGAQLRDAFAADPSEPLLPEEDQLPFEDRSAGDADAYGAEAYGADAHGGGAYGADAYDADAYDARAAADRSDEDMHRTQAAGDREGAETHLTHAAADGAGADTHRAQAAADGADADTHPTQAAADDRKVTGSKRSKESRSILEQERWSSRPWWRFKG